MESKDINEEGLLYDDADHIKIAEKFNIQLAPIPIPELTAEIATLCSCNC